MRKFKIVGLSVVLIVAVAAIVWPHFSDRNGKRAPVLSIQQELTYLLLALREYAERNDGTMPRFDSRSAAGPLADAVSGVPLTVDGCYYRTAAHAQGRRLGDLSDHEPVLEAVADDGQVIAFITRAGDVWHNLGADTLGASR